MCDTDRIQEEVERFIENDELFTSVDIANAIKRGNATEAPQKIRNREVASFLRSETLPIALQLGKNYEATPIPVQIASGAIVQATLYHPYGADVQEYDKTSQTAITPDEFDVLKAAWQPTGDTTQTTAQAVTPPQPNSSGSVPFGTKNPIYPDGLVAVPAKDDTNSKGDLDKDQTAAPAKKDDYLKFRFPTTSK